MQYFRTKPLVLVVIVAGVVGATLVAIHGSGQYRARAGTNTGSEPKAGGKQLWHCGMDQQVIQDHPGICPICHMALTPLNADDNAPSGKRKILYWWDPMLGPSSISDHPGRSAMGMEMEPVYGDQAGPTVTIDPAMQQNMGVRTAAVTRGPLLITVRTLGVLKTAEPALHEVSLKIGGWIERLYADQEGMHVSAGDTLFELYSPDLQVAGQELIAAIASRRMLGATANPSLLREADGLIDSSKRKLRLWDVAEPDIDAIGKSDRPPRSVPFRSPVSGHIEEKVIVHGSAVQAGMKLMRIADHTQLWLEAQVYGGQFPIVKLGQEITATIDGIPDRTFKGTLSFIYPHLDHMTRTMTVRMTLENSGFELKPGMYATAEILARPLADAILAPREAVIDTGVRQIAFVDSGAGHFEPRIVRMGAAGDGDMVQILQGLAPGEKVVTSGQFMMDVESRTVEATQKVRGTP